MFDPMVFTFAADHWGKIVSGFGALLLFAHRTGVEKQKYEALQAKVAGMKIGCGEHDIMIQTINQNVCLICGKIGVQPIEPTYPPE